jgi:PAS domain S-box-containing protein
MRYGIGHVVNGHMPFSRMRPVTEQAVLAPPRLEALIENVPGNVYRRIRRPDGTYRFAFLSAGLFRHFGIDHERLLGEPALRFDWIHPEDRERFRTDLEFSAAMLSLLDHRIRIIGQDGRVHWARGIARPERMPDGSVVWDGIVIDVTREVEAEAALRIAKDDAERAHHRTTAVVGALAAQLARPVAELGGLLAATAESSPMGQAIRSSLEACVAALEALGRGDPAAAAVSPRAGVQTRRIDALGAAALTGRQREVMGLLAEGRRNKEIAQKLGIAPGTVRLHVAAVLRALKARTRKELMRP